MLRLHFGINDRHMTIFIHRRFQGFRYVVTRIGRGIALGWLTANFQDEAKIGPLYP